MEGVEVKMHLIYLDLLLHENTKRDLILQKQMHPHVQMLRNT